MFPKIGVKPPKWMVKIMENPIKMDDLGGSTHIFGNTHIQLIALLKVYHSQKIMKIENGQKHVDSHGKPYEQMDDLRGETPTHIFGLTPIWYHLVRFCCSMAPTSMGTSWSWDFEEMGFFKGQGRV